MLDSRKTGRSLRSKSPKVRVLRSGQRFEVWLYQVGGKARMTGSIDIRLASDAEKRGQDLVGELVDQSLKQAERSPAA